MTFISSLTFTDYEWFPWSICNGVWHASRERLPFRTPGSVPNCGTCLCFQLLRPDSSNLPCLYSTFHLEYPLILCRFCLQVSGYISYIWMNNENMSSGKGLTPVKTALLPGQERVTVMASLPTNPSCDVTAKILITRPGKINVISTVRSETVFFKF